jgi:hypothetical protein
LEISKIFSLSAAVPLYLFLISGGGLEISKIFSLSAAARLYLFLISGGDLEVFKIFSVSAAAAVFFWEKLAAAAAQPIGLHLY